MRLRNEVAILFGRKKETVKDNSDALQKAIYDVINNHKKNDIFQKIESGVPFSNELNSLIDSVNAEIKYQQLRTSTVNDAVHSGLWYMKINDDFSIAYAIWSDDFRKMVGFNDENDFPNTVEAWSNRLHPDDSKLTLDAFSSCIKDLTGNTPYDVDYRLMLKDKSYKWFHAAGNVVRNENGHPDEIIGVFVDIDDKKKKDEDLEYTLKKFEAIDSILSEGSWNMKVIGGDPVNPDNEFWWSNTFRSLLGYENENDFPNKLNSWSDSLHPDDKERVLKAFQDHIMDYSGKTPFDLEYRLRKKDGEYRWFRAVGKTIRKDNGEPVLVAGAVEDITAKKNKEEFDKKINGMIKSLYDSIAGITTAITETTEKTVEIAGVQEKITDAAQDTKNQTDETLKLTDLIMNISSQTSLLALNASIEAARAGEAGKGFAVVAEEVSKLANNSSESVEKITAALGGMEDKTSNILEKISSINDLIQNQAANMQEINASVEEIKAMATTIEDLSKEL